MASTFPEGVAMTPHMSLLLRLIGSRGNASDLVRRGLRYSQIFSLMAEAREAGFLEIDVESGSVTLTEKGMYASRVSSETGRINPDGGFILPLVEAQVDRLPIDAVYLPPRRKSFFGLDRSASPGARERKDGESPS